MITKLEIGKLYEVATDDVFYTKPLDLPEYEERYGRLGYSGWPVVYGNLIMPYKHLENQYVFYLGIEEYKKDELYKFLWFDKYVYTRAHNAIEFEYRFEEVGSDDT